MRRAFLWVGMVFLFGCGSVPLPKVEAPVVEGVRSHLDVVTCVKFSADGRRIASASWDNTIKIWRFQGRSAKLLFTLEGHTNWVLDVAFSPGKGNLLASASADSTVKIWDLQRGRLVKTLTGYTRKVNSLAFSPQGRWLAAGSEDGTVKIWSLKDYRLVKNLKHSNPILAVAFSPRENLFVCGDSTGMLYFYNPKGWEKIDEWEGHSASIRALAFREDGKFMASAGDDKVAKLWEVEDTSLSEYATLEGHRNAVLAVAFSPGGEIATGGKDRTVRIWDSEGNPLKVLTKHTHWVYSVDFNPDGTVLISATKSLANLWDLQRNRFLSFLIDPQLTGKE